MCVQARIMHPQWRGRCILECLPKVGSGDQFLIHRITLMDKRLRGKHGYYQIHERQQRTCATSVLWLRRFTTNLWH